MDKKLVERSAFSCDFFRINISYFTCLKIMASFQVRNAKAEDAYWIAFVNAHTWYETYKWLIPEKVLKARIDSINERAEKTREFIKKGKNYLVVENLETKEIIWMLIYWLSRNEAYPNSGA